MNRVYLFLTDGFEEIEALATLDILRRGNIDVRSVSLTGNRQVTGGHRVTVTADQLFEDTDFSDAELLVIPGGTVRFNEHEGLKQTISDFAREGGKVAAICAAPMVLGGLGLLEGKRATAYPGFEKYLAGATFVEAPVVTDGNIITGRGPGLALDFALALVEILRGKALCDEVARGLLLEM